MKMSKIAVVILDSAQFGAGPGTVVELSDENISEVLKRYQDRDGCRSEKLRFWLPSTGMKVGDRVVVSNDG